MFPDPETRLSLLIRVADPADPAAWGEFAELYHPVIYRTARYKGLQDADALDVTQQVLVAVRRALYQRPHDPSRARFRTWLGTVIRNAVINVQRRDAACGTGDSQIRRQLEQIEDPASEEAILEREYQKEIFRVAARVIEPEFAADTWQAFWLTTVQGQAIDQVAEQLGKRCGSIYAARSRVMRRLRLEIEKMQQAGQGG